MKVLTEPHEIREAVRDILSDRNDDRIVAVAYVGADALSFLSEPEGLTLYCWPQAGGTNPNSIEELVKAKVNVHFVRQLHAKVYWSRERGALVGSANLTRHALGEQALREAVVWMPPGAFDMDSFARSLQVEPDFGTALKQLHEAHVRFFQRNPLRRTYETQLPQVSFPDWLARGDGRQEWRLGWYEEDAKPPADAIDALEEVTGSRRYATWSMTKRRSDLREGVFTLEFRIKARGAIKVSGLEWWAPELVVPTKAKGWQEWPYIWFAQRRIPVGTRVPFVAERRFRKALAVAIGDSGGLRWLENASLKPTRAFLERLSRHYEAAGS